MQAIIMKKQQRLHAEEREQATYKALPTASRSASRATPRMFDSEHIETVLEKDQKFASMRDWWKRSCGLETVSNWVQNYHDHPAGWGALLMIHGVPEVTGRLRTKVDNFAIYSALFLGTAIASLVAPPDKVALCVGGFECEFRKRVFTYCLIIGAVCQMLCIMLAMSFGNALNEAARDCDVFRMFSPAGNGFKATKKCEVSYQIGVGLTFVAMLAAVEAYMGIEALILSAVCVAVAGKVYFDTAGPLFNSSGIVEYWRSGKSEDDPYDIDFLVHAFERQCNSMHNWEQHGEDLEGNPVHSHSVAHAHEFKPSTPPSNGDSSGNIGRAPLPQEGSRPPAASDGRMCTKGAGDRSCFG